MLAGTVWVFPFRLPLSKIRPANKLFTRARESVGAQDLSCWPGGADTPLDSQGGGTVGVLDATGPLVRGGSVRGGTLGYGVRDAVVQVLLVLWSGLEDYTEGIT